jgi:hypothetical protein
VTGAGLDLSRDPDPQEAAIRDRPDPVLREPLTTPYRQITAIEYGAGGAGILAVLNLYSALGRVPQRTVTLVGPGLERHVIAQLAAAAVAALLALIILWRHAYWACCLVLVWAVAELAPPLPLYLYGHTETVRGYMLAITAAGFALFGVHGCWARRDSLRTGGRDLGKTGGGCPG